MTLVFNQGNSSDVLILWCHGDNTDFGAPNIHLVYLMLDFCLLCCFLLVYAIHAAYGCATNLNHISI